MNTLTVIAGPTAVGKSSSAIGLAKRTGAEIVSVDAYQCYRYMDIGTAKPSQEELQSVRHHMIDEYDPSVMLSVSDYTEKTKKIIEENLPDKPLILCGGSGLYIDSIVLSNYDFSAGQPDEEYRSYLQNIADTEGKDVLFSMLEKTDPAYALLTHPNNVKRVIRALEYFHETGTRMSENVSEKTFRYPDTRYFVLSLDRSILYPRIDRRVDMMVEAGLLNEVTELYERYHDRNLTSMRAIGYQEVISYLEGEISFDRAIELVKQHSRNYAKRQYTWFRSDPFAEWIELDGTESGEGITDRIEEKLRNV